MKSHDEVLKLLAADRRTIEETLGIKIRNGQASTAVKKTLAWVLAEGKKRKKPLA